MKLKRPKNEGRTKITKFSARGEEQHEHFLLEFNINDWPPLMTYFSKGQTIDDFNAEVMMMLNHLSFGPPGKAKGRRKHDNP
jgi:hypothetical protein